MKNVKALLLAVLCVPIISYAQKQASHTTHRHAATHAKHSVSDSLVRGVSFLYFKNSVSDFNDSSKLILADSAWTFWKAEKWNNLEQFFTRNSLNGGWPPNRGALSLKIVTLPEGVLIDRYGGYYDTDSVFQDKGTFVSMKGVPFPERALPDKTLNSPYRVYRIMKPIPDVKEGGIIPWFGKPGLAKQYELPYTVNDLKSNGYLKEEAQ
ncbi:TNT domain-containing protein [Chitinophagaceae bacterium MMS25-I14]